MTIILTMKKVDTEIARNVGGRMMKLTTNINPALNAGGMLKKKSGEKQENQNRQIMKWEMQTFSQGGGFKMFANVLRLGAVCVGLWGGNCAKVLLCISLIFKK